MIEVQLWGGGGAGGYFYENNGVSTTSFGGGAGGYTTCTIAVSEGQNYYIFAGQGGQTSQYNPPHSQGVNAFPDGGAGYAWSCNDNCASSTCNCNTSGGGGGRSAIQLDGTGIDLVTGIVHI